MRLWPALAAMTLVLPSAIASPDDEDEAPTVAERFNFDWEAATDDDDRVEFERLMSKGRAFLLQSADAGAGRSGADSAMRAADFFDRASKLRPDDPKPHYLAAESLRAWDDITYAIPARINKTIEHLSEFIRLSPHDSRVPEALFARSIALTKLALVSPKAEREKTIRLALDDYDTRLQMENQLSLDAYERADLGLLLSNSAELFMYVGELDKAIALYYDSLEYATGESSSLYRYGLAVALDRDGQRTRAADIMSEAMRNDPRGPLGQLNRPGVFFIPAGDIQFYRGLGQEILGNTRKAKTYYERFIDSVPDSPYAGRAVENLAKLGGKASKTNKAKAGAGPTD